MRTSLPLIALAAALLPSAALADQRAFRPYAEGLVGGVGIQRDAQTPLGTDADRGGSGILGGARVGIGGRPMPASGLWLGAEIEGWGADGRSNSRLPGSACADCLRVDGALGTFGRIGWQLPGGTLIHGRIGWQGLATDHAHGGRSESGWQGALALGAGAEIPIAKRVYVRLDGTWSRAGSTDLDAWQGTAAIGWHF
jgi:opacity protein-like surface antigen